MEADRWAPVAGGEFIRELPEIITANDPEGYDPGQPNSGRVERRMLAPKVQLLMWHLIDLLHAFFAENTCLANGLTEDNIRVNRWTCVLPTAKTDELVGQNMASLSAIFERSILARSSAGPPPEVANLLHLMKTKAVTRLFLIRFHPCLCPVENRGSYFVCLRDIAYHGMREINGLGNGDGRISWMSLVTLWTLSCTSGRV